MLRNEVVVLKKKTFRPMARATMRFENELEIKLHKIVSSLCYGQEVELEIEDDPDIYVYAAKKSAYYNCMDDLKVVLAKDKKTVRIYMEI